MSYDILRTAAFTKHLKQLSKKYPSLKNDYTALLDSLQLNPIAGSAIGKDCYKIRMKISSKNTGKSGGAISGCAGISAILAGTSGVMSLAGFFLLRMVKMVTAATTSKTATIRRRVARFSPWRPRQRRRSTTRATTTGSTSSGRAMSSPRRSSSTRSGSTLRAPAPSRPPTS